MGCKISSLMICTSKKNKVSCKKKNTIDENKIELNKNTFLYRDNKNTSKKTDKIIDFDDIPNKGSDEIL